MPYDTLESQAPVAEQSGTLKAFMQDNDSRAALSRAAKALGFTATVHAGTVRTAIKSLDGTRSPDLLVIDLSGIDLEQAAMEDLAQVCEPTVRVIAVGDQNDIGLYRRLKSLGVADYLYKPVTQERFEHALAEVTGQTPRRLAARCGKLISVMGARGGVGTTTLSVNLASYLANTMRRRVALVDLDLAAGTTSLLLNTASNAGLREALDDPDRVDAKFLERAMVPINDRLSILGSDGEKMPTRGLAAEGVRTVLERVQALYHYTVVDVPASLAAADPAVLGDSDIVFVVCDGTLAGVRDTARLSRILSTTCPKVRIVLNRAGAPGQVSMPDLERMLGSRPDLTVPFLPRPFASAAILGTPAVAQNRRVASALSDLAREVSGRPARPASLFDRIFRR